MTKISKILNILTYVMIAITAVLLGLFFLGGEIPNQIHPTPIYTEELIVWAYILLAIAAGAAVIFPVARFVTNPKEAVKGLVGIAVLGIVVLVSYSMADATILDLPGYTGTDNVPSKLLFADTVIYTMYILGVGAVASIIVTEIIRKLR